MLSRPIRSQRPCRLTHSQREAAGAWQGKTYSLKHPYAIHRAERVCVCVYMSMCKQDFGCHFQSFLLQFLSDALTAEALHLFPLPLHYLGVKEKSKLKESYHMSFLKSPLLDLHGKYDI